MDEDVVALFGRVGFGDEGEGGHAHQMRGDGVEGGDVGGDGDELVGGNGGVGGVGAWRVLDRNGH